MYEIASSLSYLPFMGIAEFLLARCFLLRYRRAKNKKSFGALREAHRIESAFKIMDRISDRTFREDIAECRLCFAVKLACPKCLRPEND